MIRHCVADFDVWQHGYDEADWLCKKHGVTYASVHRDELVVLMAVHRFRDIEGAMVFVYAVSALMEDIGVKGQPEIWFGEDL